MDDRLYFAYGSNINLDQMAHRCPNAQVVGPVVLQDYKLLFRGNDRGNGVATIKPHKGRKVYGLLWKITPDCERSLDVYEGFPRLYDKQDVTVRDSDGREFTVMAYVMTDTCKCRDPAVPSIFYYNGIRTGFLQNGLPVKALDQAVKHAEKEVDAVSPWRSWQPVQNRPRKKEKNSHER